MNNAKFKALLKSLRACAEAVKWVGDRDLAAVWNECERADWRQRREAALRDMADIVRKRIPVVFQETE